MSLVVEEIDACMFEENTLCRTSGTSHTVDYAGCSEHSLQWCNDYMGKQLVCVLRSTWRVGIHTYAFQDCHGENIILTLREEVVAKNGSSVQRSLGRPLGCCGSQLTTCSLVLLAMH